MQMVSSQLQANGSCYYIPVPRAVFTHGPPGPGPRGGTWQTGDANLRLLRYNCERRMTQNCLLTRAWFLRT
jgi:hypothetical protein